ncbi:hypothetical protein J2Z33_000928 [Rubellimicrobium aerolatum]|nr:hypothetical protein [Rubellimicrobium aerolatum]
MDTASPRTAPELRDPDALARDAIDAAHPGTVRVEGLRGQGRRDARGRRDTHRRLGDGRPARRQHAARRAARSTVPETSRAPRLPRPAMPHPFRAVPQSGSGRRSARTGRRDVALEPWRQRFRPLSILQQRPADLREASKALGSPAPAAARSDEPVGCREPRLGRLGTALCPPHGRIPKCDARQIEVARPLRGWSRLRAIRASRRQGRFRWPGGWAGCGSNVVPAASGLPRQGTAARPRPASR